MEVTLSRHRVSRLAVRRRILHWQFKLLELLSFWAIINDEVIVITMLFLWTVYSDLASLWD